MLLVIMVILAWLVGGPVLAMCLLSIVISIVALAAHGRR